MRDVAAGPFEAVVEDFRQRPAERRRGAQGHVNRRDPAAIGNPIAFERETARVERARCDRQAIDWRREGASRRRFSASPSPLVEEGSSEPAAPDVVMRVSPRAVVILRRSRAASRVASSSRSGLGISPPFTGAGTSSRIEIYADSSVEAETAERRILSLAFSRLQASNFHSSSSIDPWSTASRDWAN